MGRKIPTVSIGLPVFNGEKYLAQAMESLLKQTYGDFELIVSDNASEDKTAEVVSRFKDPRIRYYRQEHNIGSGPNFNFVLNQAQGKYFKWMAHDDLCEPDFLEQCVHALESDPLASLCYSHAKIIDAQGQFVEVHHIDVNTGDGEPLTRFTNLMLSRGHRCYEIFGLIRKNLLDETDKMGSFAVADRILLAQLALRGPFRVLEEPLFVNRRHPEQFSLRMPNQHEATFWFDPNKKNQIIFPEWKAFNEYRLSLAHFPLSFSERIKSKLYLLQYLRMYRHRMGRDLLTAFHAWRKRR